MQGNLNQQGLNQQGLNQAGLQQGLNQGLHQQGGLQQGLNQGLHQQGGLQQGLVQGQQGLNQQGLVGQQVLGGEHHHGHHLGHHHQGQGLVSGIPTTQSTNMTGFNQGEQVLSQIHGGHQQQGYVQQGMMQQQQHIPQQGYQQNVMQSGGQPLQFSGVQANVLPVGGVPGSVEQYATEALMRGTDPLNTQQHYQYNVVNGSTNPGFTGIPMNYGAGNAGHLPNQTPQSLTQTPLYSGSQPLQYEGNEGHAARLSNTHTTGHHNEGALGKLGHKVDQMDHAHGQHSTGTHESHKNLKTGDF